MVHEHNHGAGMKFQFTSFFFFFTFYPLVGHASGHRWIHEWGCVHPAKLGMHTDAQVHVSDEEEACTYNLLLILSDGMFVCLACALVTLY
jgi:hypothetical protein